MNIVRRISDLAVGNMVLLGGDEYFVVKSDQVGSHMMNIQLKHSEGFIRRSIFRYADEILEVRN